MPCTYLIGPCNNATLWASCFSRYFKCNSCKVSFDNDNYPLLILFVNNSNAQFTYLLSISYLNLDEIFSMFIGLTFDGNLSCFVLLCSALPMILPSSHNFIHFSNALKCSPPFHLWLGFCRSNDGIIWIVQCLSLLYH